MSFSAPTVNGSSQPLASTSANPSSGFPASYHPQPRPAAVPPLERADMHALKQDLHDALGEHGLAYWKALNGYLLGQVGRGELVDMVKGWLKGKKVLLHNRLLVALMSNASLPPSAQARYGITKKRKRVPFDHPDYDNDETTIDPRERVSHWAVGLSANERSRLRKAIVGKESVETDTTPDEAERRLWSAFDAASSQPVSLSSRHLPSSHQLAHRLSQIVKGSGMSLAPDALSEIGEFMAIGVDAHLGDVLHSVVHLTGKGRPGDETIRLPGGIKLEHGWENGDHHGLANGSLRPNGADHHADGSSEGTMNMPKPDLRIFQHLFELDPTLHPKESPTLYKLANSQTIIEAEMSRAQPVEEDRKPSRQALPLGKNPILSPVINGAARLDHGTLTSTPKSTPAGRFGNGPHKSEIVAKELLENGLLKLDKAGRQGDGADGAGESTGRKDRKHNLHWKYEDPAVLLKDILG